MAKIKCAHCRLSFDESAMISGENGHKFCCAGCKGVFEILNSNGLGEFYDRLGKNTLEPVKQDANDENLAKRYKDYIVSEEGFSKISLIITGIHCSACIWLNEKILFNAKGVLSANINALNHKAVIVFDENEISLGEILRLISSVGYSATPFDASAQDERMSAQRREFYAKLLVGIFGVMNIMWLAVAQYSGHFSGMRGDIRSILNFAEFILASAVLFYTGGGFFKGAYFALKNRTQNMDLLVVSGTLAAYIFSIYSMFSRQGEVYFDSVTMIITFVFIGKYLEMLSKKRAYDTLERLNLMVLDKVSVLDGGSEILKSAADVGIGELVRVRAGERALLDGVIINGSASFDYSSLTGESAAVFKEEGGEISGGAICLDGAILYEVKRKFGDSALSKIINLLENATTKKPKIEQLANEISAKFSGAIMALSIITFAFWLWHAKELSQALIVGISVIVIACPCALALATPVSALVGLGAGFKRGILFKEAKILESLAKCDTVVFDKTGTLTAARPKVSSQEFFMKFEPSLLYSMAKISAHPVSVAVARHLEQEFSELNIKSLQDVKNIQAKGVSARSQNVSLVGGNARLMRENGVEIGEQDDQNAMFYFFAINGELAAKFSLKDNPRDEAKACVYMLKSAKFDIFMLTGDNAQNAKFVAGQLGIERFYAECSSEDKARFVEELAASGKRVLMVGDGVNDAPALALSSVAVCMGSGADVSLARSDVVLMRDDLSLLVGAVALARRTFSVIRQNLAFSLIYNAVTIPLAMAGYVSPVIAAASMSLSSVAVILNAMRIGRVKLG